MKGIPFLAFDAGGVLEMFDQASNENAVILEPSISALYDKIKGGADSHEPLPPVTSIHSISNSVLTTLLPYLLLRHTVCVLVVLT